jgi:hypothetical protein
MVNVLLLDPVRIGARSTILIRLRERSGRGGLPCCGHGRFLGYCCSYLLGRDGRYAQETDDLSPLFLRRSAEGLHQTL